MEEKNTPKQPTLSAHSPSSSQAPDGVNYERLHYDKHIDFFKWMIGIAGTALTIMVGIATCSTYSSVKEYKDDVKNNMNEIKGDIKEIKAESISTIRNNREDVEKQVSELNRQVKEQIPLIKESAENLALSSVRKSINEQFEANNIRELISRTADEKLKMQVGHILDEKIKNATTELDEQTKAVATLSVAVDQIRAGDRRWFEKVQQMSREHKLPIIRELATVLLKQKANDYTVTYGSFEPNNNDTIIALVNFSSNNPFKKDADSVVKILIKQINVLVRLDELALTFLALDRVTGKQFEMFDFDAVNNWFRNKYPSERDKIRQRVLEKHFVFIE